DMKNNQRIKRTCINCRTAQSECDFERPCKRCAKFNVPCQDDETQLPSNQDSNLPAPVITRSQQGENANNQGDDAHFGWFCIWPNCDYRQKGRCDVFKAKRHVWDKHLRKTSKFNSMPIYEYLSIDERNTVHPAIFMYLENKTQPNGTTSSSVPVQSQ